MKTGRTKLAQGSSQSGASPASGSGVRNEAYHLHSQALAVMGKLLNR